MALRIEAKVFPNLFPDQLRDQAKRLMERYQQPSIDPEVAAALNVSAGLLEDMKQELGIIDAVLSRRDALDHVPTRVEKILLTLKVAAVNDPKGELAKLVEGRDADQKLIAELRDEIRRLSGLAIT